MEPLFLLRPISGFALFNNSALLLPPTRFASPSSDSEKDDDPTLQLSLSCDPFPSSTPPSSYPVKDDDPMFDLSLSCDPSPSSTPPPTQSASSDSNSTVIDQEDDCPWLRLSLSCIPPPSSSSSSSLCKSKKKRKRSLNQETGPRKKTALLGGQGSEEFVINKYLEESDVNNLARLLLRTEAVEKHLLPHWDDEMKESLKDKQGVVIRVWDRDCDIVYDMKMKTWGHGSVVLNDRWITKFVRRRGLKRGDRIGLYWDRTDRRLVFSLLHQEPIDVTPISFKLPD